MRNMMIALFVLIFVGGGGYIAYGKYGKADKNLNTNFEANPKVTKETVVGFEPLENIELDAGQSKDVKIEEKLHEPLTDKYTSQDVNLEKVEILISIEGVVNVSKGENAITIQAEEEPLGEKTEVLLVQIVEGEKQTVTIPVTIKNYEQPQEQKTEDFASKWKGEWERTTQHNEGGLSLSNIEDDSLTLSISVISGGNTGDMEGIATFDGDKAAYMDGEFDTGCRLDLTLKEDRIEIKETPECTQVGGMGTFFAGDYHNVKEAVEQTQNTLASMDLLPSNMDAIVQELVGEDYNVLMANMQLISNGEEYGLQESLVIEGAVQGMYTIMESIIFINMFGDYNIASIIDGEKIRFYTNEEANKDQLPFIIEEWSKNFSHYPVEYIYKDVKKS